MTMQTYNRNDAHCNTGDRENDIFYEITQHDAVHTANDRVKCGKQRKNDSINMRYVFRRNMEGEIGLNRAPGNENLHEFSEPYKTICQETKTSEQCENHHADM